MILTVSECKVLAKDLSGEVVYLSRQYLSPSGIKGLVDIQDFLLHIFFQNKTEVVIDTVQSNLQNLNKLDCVSRNYNIINNAHSIAQPVYNQLGIINLGRTHSRHGDCSLLKNGALLDSDSIDF